MKKSTKPAPKCCAIGGEALPSAEATYVVVGRSIPESADPEFHKLGGARVCKECSRLLRTAGIRTYNLARQRERQRQGASATICEILAAKAVAR